MSGMATGSETPAGHHSCPQSANQAESLPPSYLWAESLWTTLGIYPGLTIHLAGMSTFDWEIQDLSFRFQIFSFTVCIQNSPRPDSERNVSLKAKEGTQQADRLE